MASMMNRSVNITRHFETKANRLELHIKTTITPRTDISGSVLFGQRGVDPVPPVDLCLALDQFDPRGVHVSGCPDHFGHEKARREAGEEKKYRELHAADRGEGFLVDAGNSVVCFHPRRMAHSPRLELGWDRMSGVREEQFVDVLGPGADGALGLQFNK